MNLEILSETEQNLLSQLIESAQHIVICCHKSPDGDAIGSSLAWAEYLRDRKKEPQIIIPDAFPDFLKCLPGIERMMRYDKHKEEADDMQTALDASPAQKVMMDHHLNPTMDTALTISHTDMSSTCEIVFRVVWQLGGFDMMNRKAAVAIYCGMMTDTGSFTYNSCRPEIYTIIGHLLTKGFDKDKIYRQVYNNYSSWAIRFRGFIMSQKLNLINDYNAS